MTLTADAGRDEDGRAAPGEENRGEMERLVAEAYDAATGKGSPARRPRRGRRLDRQGMVRLLLATVVLVAVWDVYVLTRPVEILDSAESLENMSFAVVTAVMAVESFQKTYGRLPRNLEEVRMEEWDVRYWARGEEYEVTAETDQLMIFYRSGDDIAPLATAAGVPAVRR